MNSRSDAVERNERLNAEWRRKHYELTEKVREWFAAASRRKFKAPALHECAPFATTLLIVQNVHQAERARVEHKTPAATAARYGKLFLTHLEKVQKDLSNMIGWADSLITPPIPSGNRSKDGTGGILDDPVARDRILLEKFCEVGRALHEILPDLGRKEQAHQDPIRYLAAEAKKAWALANNGEAPQSTKPGDPLVKFLVAALAEIGMTSSPHTVSSVLAGRRRKGGTAAVAGDVAATRA